MGIEYNKTNCARLAKAQLEHALDAHSYGTAAGSKPVHAFGALAQYAAARIAALKPAPPNKWVQAAEDVLVHATKATLPDEPDARLRRLVKPHVAATASRLNNWKNAV